FIIDELKPFIDANYRTLSSRENTAVMGSSMGGLISFYLVWNFPDVFSKAGCLSSSFYFDDEHAIKMVKNYIGHKKNIKIYLDNSKNASIGNQRRFYTLKKKGFMNGKDIDYYYAPDAVHNVEAWAERLERPLRSLFGKQHLTAQYLN